MTACWKDNTLKANHDNLFRLLATGYVALIAVTWPLWTPQTLFPQVPLISIAAGLPKVFEQGTLCGLLAALVAMLFADNLIVRRVACLVTIVCTLGLVLADQHRLQPWTWQFVIVSFILATADESMASRLWSVFVVGIYAWSAGSKLDYGFCSQHGPFILAGLFKSMGLSKLSIAMPDGSRLILAAMIPVFEMLVAIGLCWQPARRWAIYGAAAMHAGLLLALGPLGHNHQPGVLLWNLFFLVQNWLLFCRKPNGPAPHHNQLVITESPPIPDSGRPTIPTRIGNRAACLAVVAALIWPIFESFGYCDHWPAWAVYAAKPERVTIYLSKTEVTKLPDPFKEYLGQPDTLDDWYPLRIDRWSLDTLHAPLYPQDRFQVGIALGVARRFDLQSLKVVIEKPANRWTGNRTVHEFDGIKSVEQLSDSFRLNAKPR